MDTNNDKIQTAILGAGITGMTSAYWLHRKNVPVRVFEADDDIGGASRTIHFHDFLFDLGGHRFYTRNKEVLKLIDDLLGKEMVTVSRISRIFLNDRFVDYPLGFFNALGALGPVTSMAVAFSYAAEKFTQLFHTPPEVTFEQWVVSRFGRRLYEIYFKPYSEKVWGIPCSELGADFAAQRIKGMSFREALKNMFIKKNAPASLVSQFIYPSRGFGRIHESMAEALPSGSVEVDARVVKVEHDDGRITHVTCQKNGVEYRSAVEQVISTIPVTELVKCLSPAAPKEVLAAAANLKYRDMVIIFLTLDREQVTPDHWIYFPTDPFISRFHEPKNWSKKMAPEGKTSLVVEVFCFEDEPVFKEADPVLVERATKRLVELGLIQKQDVSGSLVIRLKKAYPLYVHDYQQYTQTIFEYLGAFKNLQLAGRNGRYKYTSADYYIEMGLRAAENTMGANHDLDLIASSKEYAEK
ncbi:MAG: FAD-dependent oxidoreductase [bacterium]